MRRFAGPALLVVVALAAGGCGTAGDEGRTASRRMDAAGVTRLEVDSGFDVRVGLGQPEAVTVTYDADLAELVDVAVDGTTLRVGLRPRDVLGGRPTPRAEVTIGRLDEVRVAGGSTVTVAGPVRGPRLLVGISGSSRVAADLDLDRADATVSGSSRLELSGTAGTLEVDGSGASTLELAGLRLHDLDIQLSGASRAAAQTDGTIAAQLSGASRLTYGGNPRFTRRDVSGASTIQPT